MGKTAGLTDKEMERLHFYLIFVGKDLIKEIERRKEKQPNIAPLNRDTILSRFEIGVAKFFNDKDLHPGTWDLSKHSIPKEAIKDKAVMTWWRKTSFADKRNASGKAMEKI